MQKNLMILGAMISVCGQGAMADVIYTNGAPDAANAWHSDLDSSTPGDTAIVGDDFALAQSENINSVTFYGLYALGNTPADPDNFTIAIYDYSGGTPSSTALHTFEVGSAVTRDDTGMALFGLNIYSYTADIATLNLDAGNYLFSVYNNTPDLGEDWYWASSDSSSGNNWNQSAVGGDWGSSVQVEMAFSLNYTVPAPSSMAVLSLGLVGLGRRRRA